MSNYKKDPAYREESDPFYRLENDKIVHFRDLPTAEELAEIGMSPHDLLDFADDPEYLELTELQRKFVFAYFFKDLRGWSLAKCYIYASNKTTHDSAAFVGAYKLRDHPKINPFLKRIDAHRIKEMSDFSDLVYFQERAIAGSDIVDFLEDDGLISKEGLKNLPKHVSVAIQSIDIIENSVTGEVRYKLKLWDKGASLARIQKIRGMNAPEKVEVNQTNLNLNTAMDPKEAATMYQQMMKGDI